MNPKPQVRDVLLPLHHWQPRVQTFLIQVPVRQHVVKQNGRAFFQLHLQPSSPRVREREVRLAALLRCHQVEQKRRHAVVAAQHRVGPRVLERVEIVVVVFELLPLFVAHELQRLRRLVLDQAAVDAHHVRNPVEDVLDHRIVRVLDPARARCADVALDEPRPVFVNDCGPGEVPLSEKNEPVGLVRTEEVFDDKNPRALTHRFGFENLLGPRRVKERGGGLEEPFRAEFACFEYRVQRLAARVDGDPVLLVLLEVALGEDGVVAFDDLLDFVLSGLGNQEVAALPFEVLQNLQDFVAQHVVGV